MDTKFDVKRGKYGTVIAEQQFELDHRSLVKIVLRFRPISLWGKFRSLLRLSSPSTVLMEIEMGEKVVSTVLELKKGKKYEYLMEGWVSLNNGSGVVRCVFDPDLVYRWDIKLVMDKVNN